MVLLQHKLSVKLSQRQILTPGLVQMVSVLALNKLELKDMINAEMVENPVLEELEESVPLIDEVGRKEEDRDRLTAKTSTEEAPITAEKKDPFEEIDFGSFFQDYLDPGYRTRGEMEEIERPSFENFLSKPTTLTDHLAWQLGALSLRPEVREAAEQIIGNLNEDGYLIASDEEMLGVAPPATPEADAAAARNIVIEAQALGLDPSASGDAVAEDENLVADPLAANPSLTDLDVPLVAGIHCGGVFRRRCYQEKLFWRNVQRAIGNQSIGNFFWVAECWRAKRKHRRCSRSFRPGASNCRATRCRAAAPGLYCDVYCRRFGGSPRSDSPARSSRCRLPRSARMPDPPVAPSSATTRSP